jgi:hypothetical protein
LALIIDSPRARNHRLSLLAFLSSLVNQAIVAAIAGNVRQGQLRIPLCLGVLELLVSVRISTLIPDSL